MIATLKVLGASGRRVFAVYLTQVLLLALIGGVIGVMLGATLPYLIVWGFGTFIPFPIVPALHPAELALALIYGLLTALVFALWPLGRAHDVPVGELFRDAVAAQPRWPRKIYIALTATATAVLVLASVAVLLAYDKRVAIIYIAVAAGVFVLLRLVASLLMFAARHAPRALHRAAHGHRQYPPAEHTDADHRAVAGPGHHVAGHRDRNRRQSAPAVFQRTAGQGAVVLFPRYPVGPGRALRQFRAHAGAGREPGGGADAARAHRLR